MIELKKPYRLATPQDARAMAELVNIAGEDMPLYLWSKIAEIGDSPWAIGRQRAIRESGSFSYRNTVFRENGGGIVSALIGYPLPDEPEQTDYKDLPAMIAPLQQLEDLAPGSWYVNVLATYPDFRGKGYGAGLLDIAEELAADTGRARLSIIVTDANVGARRLYERLGYTEIASRPMIKESWQNPGENWVLLTKSV